MATRESAPSTAARFSAARFSAGAAAARRSRRTRVLVALAVLAVLLGTAEAVRRSSLLRVADIQVAGTDRVTEAAVLRAAAVSEGSPIYAVDLAGVRERVGALPAVRTVRVARKWPRTVRITVVERVPAAVLASPADGLVLVDASGAVIETVRKAPAGLLTIRAADRVEPVAVRGALAVVAALTPELRARATALRVSSRDDIVVTLRGGVTVVWGSGEDSARKVAVLTALLPKKATRYDVSAPGAPAYR
jgi:cell division protein FtsQ